MCALCDLGYASPELGCAAVPAAEVAVDTTSLAPTDTAAAAPSFTVQALLSSSNPGWNSGVGRSGIGQGGVVNYSFARDSEPAVDTRGGFQPMSGAQEASARLALKAWAEVSGLAFVEVPDHSAGAGIDIRFGLADAGTGYAGFASYPQNGAVRLSNSYAPDQLTPGSYGYYTLLHEIGHALGLKHPFDYGGFGTAVLPTSLDTWQNTVMSYDRTGPTPTGLKAYDIAAISYVYGDQASQPAWATSAHYDAGSDAVVMTGDSANEIIWGTGRRSIVLAGGGDDLIYGGIGSERLSGDDGNDLIYGDRGADTLLGGTGNDTLYAGDGDDWVAGGAGSNLVSGGDGIDTLAVAGGRLSTKLPTPGQYKVIVDGNPIAVFGGTITSGDESTSFTGIENFAFLDGRLVFASSDPVMQVYRFYQAALGRAPDSLGLNDWTGQVQAGTSLATVAAGFVNSPEFTLRFGALDDNGFIARTYENVLGRAPDAGGYANWGNALSHGLSRAEMVVGFSESAEFKARLAPSLVNGLWDQDENAATAARVYQATLGRHPDEGGLRYWDSALDGGMPLRNMVQSYMDSPEFTARYGNPDNATFVNLLYGNVLGRAADAVGLANWKGALDAGTLDRPAVVLGFSESTEFKGATQSWIEGGIVFV